MLQHQLMNMTIHLFSITLNDAATHHYRMCKIMLHYQCILIKSKEKLDQDLVTHIYILYKILIITLILILLINEVKKFAPPT